MQRDVRHLGLWLGRVPGGFLADVVDSAMRSISITPGMIGKGQRNVSSLWPSSLVVYGHHNLQRIRTTSTPPSDGAAWSGSGKKICRLSLLFGLFELFLVVDHLHFSCGRRRVVGGRMVLRGTLVGTVQSRAAQACLKGRIKCGVHNYSPPSKEGHFCQLANFAARIGGVDETYGTEQRRF
jgi:hypothetical protein